MIILVKKRMIYLPYWLFCYRDEKADFYTNIQVLSINCNIFNLRFYTTFNISILIICDITLLSLHLQDSFLFINLQFYKPSLNMRDQFALKVMRDIRFFYSTTKIIIHNISHKRQILSNVCMYVCICVRACVYVK
jgi:hypothetical protein